MFTDENTEGYSEKVLRYMNAELEAHLNGFEFGTSEYYDEEDRASEEILREFDASRCEFIDKHLSE